MASEFRNTSLAFYPGGRPYNNKDFRVLQQLVLDTTSFFQAFTNVNAGQFIVSGCTALGDEGFVWLGTYNIDPSINDRKLRFVETWSGAPLTYPCYIGETNSSQTRTYKDGVIKDVFIISTAYWSQSIPPSGVYITFNNAGDFTNFKLETTFASIGASFWTQVPATSNIQFALGDVGIGTTTPTSIGASYTTTDMRGVNGAGIAMGTPGTPIGYVYSDSAGLHVQSQAYPITFQTNGVERMRITGAGQIGIGTNAPTALMALDVRGNLRVGDGTSPEQDITYYNSVGNWQVGINTAGNGTSNDQYYIYDSAYRLTVQRGTGNVGIGTVTPAAKLDVQGNITATTSIAATTTITAGTGLTVTTGNINVASGTIAASGAISGASFSASGAGSFGGTVSGALGSFGTLAVGGGGTFGSTISVTTGNLTLSSGNITISGNGTANDWIATSDVALKENISTIDNALELTQQLTGHTYYRKDKIDDKKHFGFIAQEVEEILPELVEYVNEEKTLKGVNYTKMSAILVEAIKSQQRIIEELHNRLQKLEGKNI